MSAEEATVRKHSGIKPALWGVGKRPPVRHAARQDLFPTNTLPRGIRRSVPVNWVPRPVSSWDGPSKVFPGGRSIRVVLYGRISAEDMHSIWIEHQTTYGDIAKELATIDASYTFTVLEPIWGPTPWWTESDPNSRIGNTIQVLYAVVKDDRWYIVGVVRASLSDYPVAIFESSTEPLRTVPQAIVASHPELEGRIKSITGLREGQSGKYVDLLMANFNEVMIPIINTSDDPPKSFVTELSTGSIPPLLRVPFAYCENLMKQAYDLEGFALQVIHILRAILHIIASLAKKTEVAFKDDSSDIETALLIESEVFEWLRATPMLARNLQEIINRVKELMDSVTTGDPRTMQREIDKLFVVTCGDYPGAVEVRHSHDLFTKLGQIDHEEAAIHGPSTNSPRLAQPHADVRHRHPQEWFIGHEPEPLIQDLTIQSTRQLHTGGSGAGSSTPARQKLNERAQNNWGEMQKHVLTKHFEPTGMMEHDRRWVCTIKCNGVVIATSTDHSSQKGAHEEASLRALRWMDENGFR